MIGNGELGELADCRSALEDVLRRLDEIGAGIAAIHVDAAIAQLRKNIDVASDRLEVGSFDEEIPTHYVLPPIQH